MSPLLHRPLCDPTDERYYQTTWMWTVIETYGVVCHAKTEAQMEGQEAAVSKQLLSKVVQGDKGPVGQLVI